MNYVLIAQNLTKLGKYEDAQSLCFQPTNPGNRIMCKLVTYEAIKGAGANINRDFCDSINDDIEAVKREYGEDKVDPRWSEGINACVSYSWTS